MNKVRSSFPAALLAILALAAAGFYAPARVDAQSKAVIKVGLLTGVAGLGDKSFNDLAYEGAKKAEADLGVQLKVVEPPDLASTEGLLRSLAKAGNDLVIGVGFDMADPIKKLADEFPKTLFAVVDGTVDKPNVASLVFKEHEGSFLVGALAAMMSKSGSVGAIPAMDIPFLNRFTKAYEQGAKYVKPGIKVIVQPIGSDFGAFNDPVYHAAGGSGSGLFEAAKQAKKYAIGCNSDQDYMAEGLVLTSMMKRVDVAVFDAIKSANDRAFKAGVHSYGVANGGIGVSEMKYTKSLIGAANLARLEDLRKGIVSGGIKVVDTLANQ
jgi:basic membrane protein A